MNTSGTKTSYEGAEKQAHWQRFETITARLQKQRGKALKELSETELLAYFDQYQIISADLARARSLGAPQSIVNRLNRMAVAGHIVLYGYSRKPQATKKGSWWAAFARAVRESTWALGLSCAIFFGAALVAYFAVMHQPQLGFDFVPDGFLHFEPAKEDNLHDIPSLSRPLAASAIMSNNMQVSLLAFGFGLTAGIGTTWIILFNGVHIGAIVGWFTVKGQSRALWGWVMPHGGVEILAICLAGAAGFVLAKAIYCPGQIRRRTALKQAGRTALVIELGCLVMLVFAGLIEGFVSPSGIGFPQRIGVLVLTLSLWILYFLLAGRRLSQPDSTAVENPTAT